MKNSPRIEVPRVPAPVSADAPVRPIEWRGGSVRFLDQTRLPLEEIYTDTDDYRVIVEAIVNLRVRGAPLIGIAAAYAVVLAARRRAGKDRAPADPDPARAIGELRATRPTAVNLFAALDRMERVLAAAPEGSDPAPGLLAEARAIHEEDERMCAAIGEHGAALLPPRATVITHCNAGALATGGIGTALGIIVTAARQGKSIRVLTGETRPLFQGARLTAWELTRSGIDVTVMTDSSIAYRMRSGDIDAVIIGADRISRNGDVANKIGSYGLALAAAAHGIPFYVAAPSTTIDPAIPDGESIPIEGRDAAEVAEPGGRRIIPPGAGVWAPAFDVTPARYIRAVITETGVHTPPFDFGPGALPPSSRR